MDVAVGTMLGAYRLERLLGKGSVGAVYVAEDVHLRRRVALKVLSPELAEDERFRRRFLIESQLAASLEHEHIVPIYAAGEEGGYLFLAMRLIEGTDLRGLLGSRHHLEPGRTLSLLGQVATALDAAHQIGLVHRDVKPANVLVSPGTRENAYLCDFGLAKHASSVDSLTGERSFVGTISYIAPEQIQGGPVDGRADQYALACVLYECLTGVKPFDREGELQVLFAHLREDAPRASEVEPGLGRALDAVLGRALDKSVTNRFDTCLELIAAAGEALGVEVAASETRAAQQVAPRTFLIADIRGYTAYTSEHGDDAAGRLASEFEQVMREVAGEHDGRVLEIRGDEALAVFASARNALRAALAAQERFSKSPPARGVGIGVDTGEAAPAGEGFRGSALNVAARLCSLAGPEEILASDTTIRVAGPTEGLAFGKSTEQRVKGVAEPVRFAHVVAPGAAVPKARRPSGMRKWPLRRRRALAAIAVGTLALVSALAAALLLRGGTAVNVAPHALAAFDRESGRLKWQVPFERRPEFALVDGKTAFVGFGFGEDVEVARVDLEQQKVVGTMPEELYPGPVLGNTMWAGGPEDKVVPVDVRFGAAGKPIALDRSGEYEPSDPWIATGGGSVWVAYGSPPRVARIDPGSKKVVATIQLPRAPNAQWCCGAIAFADGDVWVADRGSGDLWRIDPATNEVVAQGTLNGPWVEDLAAGGGFAWAPRTDDAGVWQIDRTLQRPRLIPTGVYPYAAAFGAGEVWVANRNDGTVTGVDPLTSETKTIDVGGSPVDVVRIGDDVVVTVTEAPPDPYAGLEGEVATVLAQGDPMLPPDPAHGAPDFTDRIQIHHAIDLKLVREDDSDGDGIQSIVADGAELPRVSDGGRTWRFRVRDGYRFSPPSGEPVTAAVFRDSIERALSPGWGEFPPFPNYLEDLVGVEDYRAGRTPHIAGLRIEGKTLVFRLQRPLRDLSARLALQPYAAVPPGTPVQAPFGVQDPLPSAGPYYLASHTPNASAVLRKNPNYPGPREAGFDAFVWRLLIANDPAIARLEDGEGDIVLQNKEQVTGARSPRMDLGGELDRRYGEGEDPRYLHAGNPFTWFIHFNTLRPPFDDLRLRKAVSLAVDREELATFWDGRAADLFIPPGTASHRPQGTVFPLRSRPAEARRLARGLGEGVTLVTDPRAAQQGMAEAIKRQLARIGIEVEIVYDWEKRDHAARYDLMLDTWLWDYVDVGITFGPILDPIHAGYDQYPVVDPPLFTDPRWIARIRAVERLSGARRDEAYARLDRDLTSGPLPIAALGHGSQGTFFSDRVGCKRVVGVLGAVDLAALCPK